MKRILLVLIAVLLFVGIQVKAEKKAVDTIVNQEIKIIKKELSQSTKDSILYEKLSADQLLELKKQESETERLRIEGANRNDMPLDAPAIVMIVLLPFLFVVVVIVIMGNIKNKESQRKYDLYTKSLEMGQSIPEHFFDEPQKQNTISNLKKGILWLSVGLALLIYFLVINETEPLFLGIVPSFIGAGYLLVHFLEKPKNSNEQNG